MKIVVPPPKRRKMSVMNEEEVDNTLVESPKQSPVRISSLALALATVPADDP